MPAPRERITTALTPKVSGELAELQQREALGKTDLVNRAISLYAYMSRELAAGHQLAVIDGDEIRELRIL